MFNTFAVSIVFILIMLPALTYRAGRDRAGQNTYYQVVDHRGLQRILIHLVPGVLFSFLGLVLFGILRSIIPNNTPNVGILLTDTGNYIQDNLPYLSMWVAGIIMISSILSLVSGIVITNLQEKYVSRVSSTWLENLADPECIKRISNYNKIDKFIRKYLFLKHYMYIQCFCINNDIVIEGYVSFGNYNSVIKDRRQQYLYIDRPRYWKTDNPMDLHQWNTNNKREQPYGATEIYEIYTTTTYEPTVAISPENIYYIVIIRMFSHS